MTTELFCKSFILTDYKAEQSHSYQQPYFNVCVESNIILSQYNTQSNYEAVNIQQTNNIPTISWLPVQSALYQPLEYTVQGVAQFKDL